MARRFYVGRRRFCFVLFFLKEPVPGTPRHICKSLTKTFKDLTAYGQYQVMFNAQGWSHAETNVRSYEATAYFCIFTAQKSKCPPHFLEIDPDCLHTCSMSPAKPWTNVFFFFRLKCWLSPQIQISKNRKKSLRINASKRESCKKKTCRYLAEKNETFRNGLTGVHRTRAPNFRFYLRKTAWTFDAWEIWGGKLEPSCRRLCKILEGRLTRLFFRSLHKKQDAKEFIGKRRFSGDFIFSQDICKTYVQHMYSVRTAVSIGLWELHFTLLY